MRRFTTVLCLAAGLLLPVTTASADWIWTPKLGRWINPKKAAKDTPSIQAEYALKFWDDKKYERALEEFQKLVKAFPQAPQAPDAQYFIGRCQEELHDYYAAFKAYRKVIQVYPASTKTEEILEREYRIGNLFFQGEKRELLGAKIVPGMDTAIEVYQSIIDDAPFSAQGPFALYKLGMTYKILGQLPLASDTFQRLVEEHPQHSLVPDAKFQVADCAAKTARTAAHDQSYAQDALQEFESFVREHPDSHLVPEAEERMTALSDQRAQQDFDVAQFYAGRKAYASAKIYYESILARYPSSQWATKAAAELQIIEGRAKK